ncbi:unnamed protein product [Ectocarpus sp. 6 AP-2014]
MDSCPVCYSAFSSEEAGTVGRRLPCGHVACTACLHDCWDAQPEHRDPKEPKGAGVRCPECFTLHVLDSVESMPVYDVEAAALEGQGDGGDELERIEEELGDAGQDGTVEEAAAVSPPPSPAPKASKFAAFLSANKAEKHVPTFAQGQDQEEENMDGQTEGRVCKVEGCDNRAVENVAVCPMHTKRYSVVSVSAMVHQFKDTKLSSVALKSDKVEVNRGGVAGAGEAGFDPDAIGERFRRQERLELGEAVALIEAVKNIFREEDNMVPLDAPVMVVGDVHGQYFDLLNILKRWRPDHNLLFLGDYVDRGQFSCEVILHLFALKLRHPKNVFLIRGNHECSSVSAHFGFKDECKMKYGLTVYYRFLLAFQTMPICALIETSIGRIFACHGGISPDIRHLSDIEEIDRFAEPEMEGPLCDMLWADPLNEDDSHKLTGEEYQHFLDTDYISNQVRGCSYMFGYHAVQRFLRENRLMYMVRAHEVQEEGFRSHFPSPVWGLAAAAAAAEEGDFSDEDSELGSEEEEEANSYDQVLADTSRHLNPTVLTVFSAPNYCDRYRNKAAVLHIERPGYYTVNLLEAEPHPAPVKESDVNVMQVLAMGNTCPYMPTTFRDFLKVAVELGRAVKPTSTNTSTVTEDLAAAAAAAESLMSLSSEIDNKNTAENRGGGGDAGGDGGGASCAPALARRSSAPAETASAAGGEGDGVMGPPPPRGLPPAGKDQEEEDDDLGAVLPSSAPRVRRGPARIISAPVLGSGGGGGGSSAGVMGGRRRRRSSGGSPAGGGVSAGVVASGEGKDGDEDDVREGEDPDSWKEEEGRGGEGGHLILWGDELVVPTEHERTRTDGRAIFEPRAGTADEAKYLERRCNQSSHQRGVPKSASPGRYQRDAPGGSQQTHQQPGGRRIGPLQVIIGLVLTINRGGDTTAFERRGYFLTNNLGRPALWPWGFGERQRERRRQRRLKEEVGCACTTSGRGRGSRGRG